MTDSAAMVKPELKFKPNNYAIQDLRMKFADGTPLSCAQLNFLAWHEKTLSSHQMDPVFKYYLKNYRHPHHSFLLPRDKLDKTEVARLKHRLEILLSGTTDHLELHLSPSDFLAFRALTINELILYHGNQLLTGAPFIPGGIPQFIYFQWGNLFGVAKYVMVADEKALKSNVLVYFEDRQERLLDECVHQFNLKLKHENQNQQLAPVMHPVHATHESPVPQYSSWFKTPTLTLSAGKQTQEDQQ